MTGIVEMRTYTLYPGKVPMFLDLYKSEGMPVQRAVLGSMIGYFTSDTADLNQIVHLWRYDGVEDRHARRARLAADAAWQEYLKKVLPLIKQMHSTLLIPTDFSPVR
ncbi:MAG: NIPSNAP family protein [Sphingomonadaceae bacterium]|nr:NIPSNAP family protein [Sphingomonadaceae bacterium]